MTPPDMRDVLAQAQQMQAKVAQLQRELAVRSFEGSAGGGMVTAVATGELRITKVTIEEQLLASGDREMIQDLTAAAVNAALTTAQRTVQEEFQKISGGMAIPGMGELSAVALGSPPIERLVAALKRLPGIGEKSATRLAFFLLGAPDRVVSELAEALSRLKHDTVLCENCFNLTDESPCAICRNETRDGSIVCVVEEPADLMSVERSGDFRGHYHVLGGALAPIDGMGPEALRIADLERRVKDGGISEIILATNPNAEGDATAAYLADLLRPLGVRLTRIAYGMPLGGDLEYADHVTVGRSIANRRDFE